MRAISLSQRLFLVTVISLLPALVILTLVFVSLRNDADRRLRDEAVVSAKIATLEMNRIVGGVESVLLAMSNSPVVRAGNAGLCDEYLASVIEVTPELSDAAIADAKGNVVCRSSTNKKSINIADRDYFQAVQSKGISVTGTYSIGRVSGRKTLPIAMPLGKDGAWPGGVIAAGLDLAWLGTRLKERDFLKGNALTIADRNGTILAREPFPERFVGIKIPDAYIHLVNAAKNGTEEVVSLDGTRRVIGYYPASVQTNGLYVSSGIATAEIYAATNLLLFEGAVIASLGILAALWLSRFTSSYSIQRPFQKLIGTIEAWQRNELDTRTDMGADMAEFGRAGRALDTFMDQLQLERAERHKAEVQRDILAHELDHRVKNILATVQAVARQSFRGQTDDPSVKAFVKRVHSMATAHRTLMLDQWNSAQIATIVSDTIDPFSDRSQRVFLAEGPAISLSSSAAMGLSMALHELCTNAAKYGALSVETGQVAIRWGVIGLGDDAQFDLTWQESGGPPVVAPTSRGFGSTMIEQILSQQIQGAVNLEFRHTGLFCRVTAPLNSIVKHAPQDVTDRRTADVRNEESPAVKLQSIGV